TVAFREIDGPAVVRARTAIDSDPREEISSGKPGRGVDPTKPATKTGAKNVPANPSRAKAAARHRTSARVAPPAITWRGRAAWRLRVLSSSRHTTEAYADRPSYLPGEEIGIAVST